MQSKWCLTLYSCENTKGWKDSLFSTPYNVMYAYWFYPDSNYNLEPCEWVCSSAQATLTKHFRMGDSYNRNLFFILLILETNSIISMGCSELVSVEGILSGLQRVTSLLCPHGLPPVIAESELASSGVSFSLYRDIRPIGLGPHP